ncbi:MAG: hypothetical protein WBE40_04790 [Thermoplasmata archaeon]
MLAEKLPTSDTGTTLTRDKWLLILFQELGYGQLRAAPRATELDSKKYPVSHFWQKVPIHLVSFRSDLDRRPTNITTTKSSPSSLLQEFLNRSPDHLWGFVSNGHRLRILRDNASLTKQAYLDFDLQAMMDVEAYSDFVILWMLCHQSRIEADPIEGCWLEQWSQAAEDDGARARESLRGGVEAAIVALGTGFLAHQRNTALREALKTATLDAQEYYRELLRLVYRIIFLAAAEDRDLLHATQEGPGKARYFQYYSVRRLRRLAERRRGTAHSDLYGSLTVVMEQLSSDEGCPQLSLPALGSYLWSRKAVPHLESAEIANNDFLDAIRALAVTRQDNVTRVVDYKRMGSEELGSIYESLLELRPAINTDAPTFALSAIGGSERKTSASYYTRTSLINAVLDSALDPLLDEAESQPTPQAAILSLKICDPASGSGHFLIASAQRMGKRLAKVRTGEDEPPPTAVRSAVRDVISHCLYGVDLNPMAVELCKVSLWLEAIEPGKPLTFLEHRIRCGNSALGMVPSQAIAEIPEGAFEPTPSDDHEEARRAKRQNSLELQGQTSMDSYSASRDEGALQSFAAAVDSLDGVSDDTLRGIRQKDSLLAELQGREVYQREWGVADAWCAAFVSPKQKGLRPITQEVLRQLRRDPRKVDREVVQRISQLAETYRFFHWQLAFPEVFRPAADADVGSRARGEPRAGFDLLLGNPPWDTLSPDAKEFFSFYDPSVRGMDKKGQDEIIAGLLESPDIRRRWDESRQHIYASVHFIKDSGRYRMFAAGNLGKGDFNIFRMFVETALVLTRIGGRVSEIVPAGLYSGANSAAIRTAFFDENELSTIIGFVNKNGHWFPGVHHETRFCMYSLSRGKETREFRATFGVENSEQLAKRLSEGLVLVPVSMIRETSPVALAIPETLSKEDFTFVGRMYSMWPRFGDAEAGVPFRHYMRELDMGNERDLLEGDPSGIPVYEGRMVDHFDHRARAYKCGRARSAIWPFLPFGSPSKAILPQWFVAAARLPKKTRDRVWKYRVGFCDIATPTAPRALVAALIPPGTICGDKVPTFTYPDGYEYAYMVWLAIANSQLLDFLARQRVALKMSFTVLDSLPFPRPTMEDPLARQLVPLAAQLTCTSQEMMPYWDLLADGGWVPRRTAPEVIPGITDERSRLDVRAQIEAFLSKDVLCLSKNQFIYILDSFSGLRRAEEKEFGEYLSKNMAVAHFDSKTEA